MNVRCNHCFKLKHDFFFLTNGDKAFEVSLKDNPKK